ncbi:creatininase family protein [Paenibacillus sp. J2TS4]|uniref:creatininase family protein n=1 Tax=Paenibacillus sp. J2TS4 TaxID=2807194 RepID=UPI001B05680A|nr:creatininase family protein [Paenibacillus sp. J2TS4]GIP34638.1 creatinine amidohydrolase [Paenibacillus sp. J2TS4]
MNSIFFHHHTRDEISAMAKAGCPVVVPLAATEQHGPHLPVYTDSIIGEHIVTHAVQQASAVIPMLAVPVLTIGCSEHHLSFGGTLSFSSSTYLNVLRDIGESLVTCGFRKIIFLNGHGGNAHMMNQTANDLAVLHSVWTASASYWNLAGAALQRVNAHESGMVPGHAGAFETALILALRPELVRTEHMSDRHAMRPWINSGPPGTFIGKHGELTGFDGYTDAPYGATAEQGRLYLTTIIAAVTDWLVSTCEAMDKGDLSYE